MSAAIWQDEGTYIALGMSLLFLVVAWAMHRAIRRVLQRPDDSKDIS